MPHQMTMNTMHKALLGIVFLGVAHQACLAGGEKCVKDPSKITEICLGWDLQPKPVEGQHFTLDFTDPANPDITLKTGNLGWTITSENLLTGGLGNVGTVSLDPAQSTDNFGVAFPSGPGSGVSSVGSINLTAASWTGHSNVTGGTIFGNAGDIKVASAPDGSGGSVSLQINASLSSLEAPSVSNLWVGIPAGNIIIGRIEQGGEVTIIDEVFDSFQIDEVDQDASVTFWGRLSGTLVVGALKGTVAFQQTAPIAGTMTVDVIDGGRIDVAKTLPTGSIKITDMESGGVALFTVVEGTIFLGNGVPTGATVIVFEGFPQWIGITVTGRIDLNGKDVDGVLHVWGGYGVIENGGMVNGTVILAFKANILFGGIFSGTAGFSGVAPLGGIRTDPLTLFSGTIDISGDSAGSIDILGLMLAPAAEVHIGGDMTGSVSVYDYRLGAVAVDGHIAGDVTFDQDASGDLVANADGIGGGDITGDVSMLNSFHGNICGDNLSPIESLPVNIDIFDFADDATICGARPGCGNGVFVDAGPADGTHDARQPHPVNDNSFGVRQGIGSPNSSGGGPEPIVVTLTAGGANHADCWSLCETGIEQVEVGTDPLSDNFVASVTETSSGVYEILLDRPISAGHWSTVTFFGDGSEVSYASLPSDANGDGLSHSNDLTALINYVNGTDTPPHGSYSTDIDHSGVTNSQDISRLIDLLNGAGTFITWMTKSLPTNTCEAQSAMGGGGGGTASLTAAVGPGQANAELSDAIVLFFVTTDPNGAEAESDIMEAAMALTEFCVEHFGGEDRVALADRLEDSNLTFASAAGADAAATAADTLRP